MTPRGIVAEIQRLRSEVAKLRRKLPKAPGGPTVPVEEMRAAYWLERAAWCLDQAGSAWDA